MRVFGFSVLLLVAVCARVSAQQVKLPPPSEEQRNEVMGLLSEVYKSEYVAAKTSKQKSSLASKILVAAKETKDNVARYAMLKLAIDIAVQAADTEIVTEAIDMMDQQYEIDEPAVRLSALSSTVKRINVSTEPAALDAVVQYSLAAIDRNDYESALTLLGGSTIYFREPSSRRTLNNLISRVRLLRSQYDNVSEHLDTLEDQPDDPEANLAVGKYRCFGRDQWPIGLRNLANGSDERLKAIATWELAGAEKGEQQVRIADGWWAYAESIEGEEARLSKLRAGAFYRLAASSLQGLQRAKAAARFREAQSLGDIPDVTPGVEPPADPPADDGPAPMTEPKVVYDLPAGFTDVVVGGSGQYLIFRLDALKKLAFFDVFAREVTQYVDIDTSDVRFTAGANEFFIAKRPENVVERWSLQSFKRLSVVKLPLEHPINALVMGSASDGPIYAGAQQGQGLFLAARSLRPIPFEVIDHNYNRVGELQGAGPESRVRASANGRVFAMWRTNVSPGGFRTYVVSDRLVHTFYDHDTMGYIEPSPDGELMYTSRGVFTNQTKEYLANEGNQATSFRVPAITGNYAIGIPRDDSQKKKKTNPVHILVSGQVDPILTIPDVSIRAGEYGDFHGREIMTLAKRVYLLPQADLLITLPESNKSLVLHRLDLEQELEDSGVDYLYVASRPPPAVQSGATYRYQIEAKSKSGDVEFEMVSGPSSMKVSKDGLVTWRTPRRSNEEHDVIVSIRDSGGQQRTHAFRVSVVDVR